MCYHGKEFLSVLWFFFSVLENERCQAEAAKEREALQQHIEANRRYEAEEAARRLEKSVNYQHDLVCQMAYNTRMREEGQALEKDEFKKAQQTEKEFQARMKQVLDSPVVENVHPMRRVITGQLMKC